MVRYTLRHRLFSGGWSKSIRRELFQRGNAVGVLVFDPVNDTIGLVEQFRIGALQDENSPWQYELVAGMVETGECPRATAIRELEEEAGLFVDELVPICDYFVSSGGTDEKMYLFCAMADLSSRGGVYGSSTEGEDILFQVWSCEEALAAFGHGFLNSAAMSISMLWLQNQRLRNVRVSEEDC
ncbi:MAG: ADP-ribose diphosphatase [Porticoccaceae bacterium]|nr:ADP-ribose diphosphatase [Porticoccaceae bacterium]